MQSPERRTPAAAAIIMTATHDFTRKLRACSSSRTCRRTISSHSGQHRRGRISTSQRVHERYCRHSSMASLVAYLTHELRQVRLGLRVAVSIAHARQHASVGWTRRGGWPPIFRPAPPLRVGLYTAPTSRLTSCSGSPSTSHAPAWLGHCHRDRRCARPCARWASITHERLVKRATQLPECG